MLLYPLYFRPKPRHLEPRSVLEVFHGEVAELHILEGIRFTELQQAGDCDTQLSARDLLGPILWL